MATIVGVEDTIAGTKRAIAMTTSDGEKKQQNIQNRIRLAICSELRRNILVALRDDKKALSELRKTVDASSTTAIHALRDLEKANLIYQDEARKYALTKIGEIITLKMVDFVDAVDVLQKHEEFWLDHDLSGIPPHMLERIGLLRDSTLIEAPATDVLKIFNNFVDILKNAKEIRGVTSMFIPEFHTLLKELTIEKNSDVELIVSKEILNGLDKEILKGIFADKSAKLKLYRMKENMKVAFTVTDNLITFGLFHIDGTYDWNKDLISHNSKAIEWGKELFVWYRKRAEEFIVDF